MLTCRSNVFACSREQARFVAECADLEHVQTSQSAAAAQRTRFEQIDPPPTHPGFKASDAAYDAYNAAWDEWELRLRIYRLTHPHPDDGVSQTGNCDLWQDRQTGGGGARICWAGGIAWVSAHSGYAWADITDEVCAIFVEIDCLPYADLHTTPDSPWIYGYQRFEESLKSADSSFVEAARKALCGGD